MSQIRTQVSLAGGASQLFANNDDRVQPPWYSQIWMKPGYERVSLWPSASFGLNYGGASPSMDTFDSGDVCWDWLSFTTPNGGQAGQRAIITGVTRSANTAAPLGGCVVDLFLTSTDEKLDTTTSDPVTGAYTLTSPYGSAAVYAVAYKPGTPDVAGTTLQTLIPA